MHSRHLAAEAGVVGNLVTRSDKFIIISNYPRELKVRKNNGFGLQSHCESLGMVLA